MNEAVFNYPIRFTARTEDDVFWHCSFFRDVYPLSLPIQDYLIIEADGTVVPLQHGLARKYMLGNLQEAPLCELTKKWYQECYSSFLQLCQHIFEEVTTPSELRRC